MLTTDDSNLADLLFSCGPSVLVENGMNPRECAEFMTRPDVVARIQTLTTEYANKEGLAARHQFMVRRRLARMAPLAVAIIGRSLVGASMVKKADGSLLRDDANRPVIEPPPSDQQVLTAQDLLDRIGIGPKAERLEGNDSGVADMFNRAVTQDVQIDYDPTCLTEDQKALSRDRRRVAIQALMPKFLEVKAKVDSMMMADAKRMRKKAARIRSKVVAHEITDEKHTKASASAPGRRG